MTIFNSKNAVADHMDAQQEAHEFFERVIPFVPDQFEGETLECDEPEDCDPFGGECEEEYLYEDDGQPTEYEEWQDYFGGDDWDHGQFDDCEGMYDCEW